MSTWTDVENGIKLKLPDAGINVISPQRLREAIQLVINQIIASTPDPVEFEWKATDDQNNSVTYEIGDPVIDDNRWFIAIAQNSNKKPVLPDGSINDAFWREENASTTRYIDDWSAKLFTNSVEIVLYNKKLYLLDRTVVGTAPYESTDIAAEIAEDPSPWYDLTPASPGGGGDLSSTDIDSITKLNAIVGTNIIFQNGNSSSIGTNATTYNNPTGQVRQVVLTNISNVNHTITFSNFVSPGSLYRFYVTKTTASDVTLNISRTFQTTTYLNSNVLKGDNNSVHLVEVHGANGIFVSTTPLVSGGGGIDPSKIVNNFSTDPNDATKVAGADAVYQLFQILASNDVDYDTLQEIVDFIKTIDTDGELVAAIDTAVGNTEWRTKYTDAEAQQAQALVKSTGTVVQFDKPRKYGYEGAAETGNITFDFTDAIEGMTQILRHNSGTEPTIPASAIVLGGSYKLSSNNYIYLTPIKVSSSPDVWEVHLSYNQS